MSDRIIKTIEILLVAAAMAIASGSSNVAAEEIPIEVQADIAGICVTGEAQADTAGFWIPGATADSFSCMADEESMNWSWKLIVYFR